MSMIWNERWDAWKDNYDSWKLATPWDDYGEEEPQYYFGCPECQDLGWMLGPDNEAMPCCECSQEITLDDLKDFIGEDL